MKSRFSVSRLFYAVATFLLVVVNVSAANGYLKMRANEDGVTVNVAGRSVAVGKQWSFLEIPEGSYNAKASKKDFQSSSKRVVITASQVTPLEFKFSAPSPFIVEKPDRKELVKGYGNLTVVTDIPGATVYLNGREVSGEVAPMTIKRLAQGSWTVVTKLNGQTQSRTIRVRPNYDHVVRLFFTESNRLKYEEAQRSLRRQEEGRKERSRLIHLEEQRKRNEMAKAEAEKLRRQRLEKTPLITHEYKVWNKSYIWQQRNKHKVKAFNSWVDDYTTSFVFKDLKGVTHNITVKIQFIGKFKYSILSGASVRSGSKSRVVLTHNQQDVTSNSWGYSNSVKSKMIQVNKFLDKNYGTFRLKAKFVSKGQYNPYFVFEAYPVLDAQGR